MAQLTIAGKPVGKIGYGLMQLTWSGNPPSEEVSLAAMKAAADAGANAWSTAGFYGNEDHLANIKLIAKFFEKYPEYLDKVVIVVKGGQTPEIHPYFDLDGYRNELKNIQSILGKKEIDCFSIARLFPGVDKETIFKGLKTLKDEGLFKEAAASELSAATLDLMQKHVPVACIEIEVSLWSYDQEIKDAIAWAEKHKVPTFCYSPLGRGFITRTYKSPEDIPANDFKKNLPRFQGSAFYDNLKLVDQLDALAEKKGLKTSQLALAWVCALSPYNIPIPGSSNPTRIKENVEAGSIKLTDEDLQGINDILAKFEVKGGRYMDVVAKLSMQ